MKKAVCPVVCILLGLSLAACRSQVDYRECPNEAALWESFFLARNDLLQGTFYCGSDTAWHYFVVKRRVMGVSFREGFRAPATIAVPFPVKTFSEEEASWVAIDGYQDWLTTGLGEFAHPPR